MNRSDFFLLLDDLLELTPGTLRRDSVLADNGWSSIAVVGFMALVDEQFGATVSPPKIAKCKTADDLVELLREYVICEV